jgi:hypothetical protein
MPGLLHRQPYAPPPRLTEVRYRPEVSSALDLPPELDRYFASRGQVASTGSRSSRMVAQLAGLGRRLVLADDLPQEMVTTLRSRGFRVDPTDKTLVLGDSALYVQSRAERDQRRAQLAADLQAREGNEELAEQIEAANRQGHGKFRVTMKDPGIDAHRSARPSQAEVDSFLQEQEGG